MPSCALFCLHHARPYLNAVLQETLRVSAIATYAAREAEHTVVLPEGVTGAGVEIPPRTPIILALGRVSLVGVAVAVG